MTGFGELPILHRLVTELGPTERTVEWLQLLKVHPAHHGSDHVLNPAYNVWTGPNTSPGDRAYYGKPGDAGDTHEQAVRAVANRLVGVQRRPPNATEPHQLGSSSPAFDLVPYPTGKVDDATSGTSGGIVDKPARTGTPAAWTVFLTVATGRVPSSR